MNGIFRVFFGSIIQVFPDGRHANIYKDDDLIGFSPHLFTEARRRDYIFIVFHAPQVQVQELFSILTFYSRWHRITGKLLGGILLFYSPLRYPGGKQKLYSFFLELVRLNSLYDIIYAEPFAGGGGLALSLLFNEIAREVYLNDLDFSVYAFWQSVLSQPEQVCKKIQDTPVTVYEWEKQKTIQIHKEDFTTLEVGFSTLFLNRTNRSGILDAGMIGGYSQKGNYKIDARYNKSKLIERVRRISLYSSRIKASNEDAGSFVRNFRIYNDMGHLFYLDPPYIGQGKRLYLNSYDLDGHKSLANTLRFSRVKNWVVSYDNVDDAKCFYYDSNSIEYTLQYSSAKSRKGSEVMFFSNNLVIPQMR